MSADTGTVAFCPGCGEVHPEASRLLSQHLQDMRTIGTLKAELTKQRRNSPQAKQAKEVFEHWVDRLGKNANVVFGPAREKAVQARLKEFPLEVVLRAVDGCALMPYVGPHGRQSDAGKGAKKHDDLSLICRDETTVERFAGYLDEPPPEAPTPIRGNGPRNDGPLGVTSSHKPADRVLLELEALKLACRMGSTAGTWMAQCPAHDDRSASLSIKEANDGRVLLNCFAGCEVTAICDSLGLLLSDLFERSAA